MVLPSCQRRCPSRWQSKVYCCHLRASKAIIGSMAVSIVLLFVVCGGFFYWRRKLRLAEGARGDGKEVRSVRCFVKEDCEFICVSQEWLIDYNICFSTIYNGSRKSSRKRRNAAANEELTDSGSEDSEPRKSAASTRRKSSKRGLDFYSDDRLGFE
jgi:hypothetical protein